MTAPAPEYVISACIEYDGMVERCDPAYAEFWTIYQMNTTGMSEAIGDFSTVVELAAAIKKLEGNFYFYTPQGYFAHPTYQPLKDALDAA